VLCETVCLLPEITDIINSGQMQRQYKSGAAKRKLKVEQEKRDEQIKKKMPCLLTYGFDTSLISNIKRKKPSQGEDNECGKTNEAKIWSKSIDIKSV